MNLNQLKAEIHTTAKEHGWWEGGVEARNIGEQIMLMVSELSEAMEEYRKYGMDPDRHIYFDGTKPEGLAVELGDCIIRILDTSAAYGLDIEKAITLKLAYNRTRGYRHGNKKA